jgi:hypothetical protein
LVIGTKLSEELAASMLRVGGIVAWGKNGEWYREDRTEAIHEPLGDV